MRRGEIYYADLNPTLGAEINKKRPVLIISNNANNRAASTLTILPLTSNTNKVYPFEVKLDMKDSGLKKNSKIQCQQIRTIAKERILPPAAGYVNNKILQKVEISLKLHLDLE